MARCEADVSAIATRGAEAVADRGGANGAAATTGAVEFIVLLMPRMETGAGSIGSGVQLFSKRLVAATAAQDTSRIGLSIAPLVPDLLDGAVARTTMPKVSAFPKAALNPQ